MTSKKRSELYYFYPKSGGWIDRGALRNGHDATRVYVLIPVMELFADGTNRIGYQFTSFDGLKKNYKAEMDTDFEARVITVFTELASKAILAELAIICDVNPIQFICSHKRQKKAIIKAFSGYEGFDAKKSFINL